MMVLWTLVYITLKKHSLHICFPVIERLRIAFAFWQRAQLFGAIALVETRGQWRSDGPGMICKTHQLLPPSSNGSLRCPTASSETLTQSDFFGNSQSQLDAEHYGLDSVG